MRLVHVALPAPPAATLPAYPNRLPGAIRSPAPQKFWPLLPFQDALLAPEMAFTPITKSCAPLAVELVLLPTAACLYFAANTLLVAGIIRRAVR